MKIAPKMYVVELEMSLGVICVSVSTVVQMKDYSWCPLASYLSLRNSSAAAKLAYSICIRYSQ